MKLNLIASVIPALFITSSAFAAIEGESSTINFTGNIIEETCTLSDQSKGQTIVLDDVTTNAFKGAGTSTQAKAFSIALEGCSEDISRSASIIFSGETAGADGKVLSTSAISTTNVGIQLLQDDNPLNVDGSQASEPLTLAAGSNTFDFAARYVAVADNVAAGEANASAGFTVSYE